VKPFNKCLKNFHRYVNGSTNNDIMTISVMVKYYTNSSVVNGSC
jgi:hypothetical protein